MLVGRGDLLASLTALLGDAIAGRGRLVFVGGEAGVGKSSLARRAADELPATMQVRLGAVDDIATADALAAFQDAVPELAAALGGRRIDVFRALRAVLAERPTFLALEDLHWADQATLDALRYLGRRLDGLPVLVVATYRHDEVGPRHPLTAVMGELATIEGVHRMLVPPLTVDEVGELVTASASPLDPERLFARTGGNAFYVTESLSAATDEVPSTVRDAVHARIARLSPAAAQVLDAASVLGAIGDPLILGDVSREPSAAVDECVEAGVLVDTGSGLGFRHELARVAVESSLAPMRRRELHRRAYRTLADRTPEDHRALAHHAAGMFDDAAIRTHAALAADRAAAFGAHREAAAWYRTALRAAAHDDAGRADLLEALSYECYLTDQHQEAIAARQQALDLRRVAGDLVRVGDSQRWLSRLSWFLGRGADAESYAANAIATLEPLGPTHELAYAYSTVAQLAMLVGDDARTQVWGQKALSLATALGDVVVEAHALNNLGAVAMEAGRIDEGQALVQRSLLLSVNAGEEEHAARAYCNLSSANIDHARVPAGMQFLDDGISYCEGRDLDSWSRYMESWRAIALADAGAWDEAERLTARLLAFPDLAPISLVQAAAVSGLIAARRGGSGLAASEQALAAADGLGALQRVAGAVASATEIAWLDGRTDDVVSLSERALTLATDRMQSLSLSKIGWWRSLVGHDWGSEPLGPFGPLRDGDWTTAADEFLAAGMTVWAAYALALAPEAERADEAVRVFAQLGAQPVVHAIRRARYDRSLPLPRRPRAAAAANPAGLTTRELDVLALLTEGGTNADIAERLFVSDRTVEHHLAAILRKLDVPSRGRAVHEARRLGIIT